MGIYSSQAAQAYKLTDVQPDPNAAGLLEFAVNVKKSEQAMFESMLEIDFREAYCANGDMVLTEAEEKTGLKAAVKAVWAKIVQLIEKAIQTVMSFISKIKNVVAEKLKIDASLANNYGKIKLSDITFSDKQKSKKVNLFKKSMNLKNQSPLAKCVAQLKGISDQSDITAITEDKVKIIETNAKLASSETVKDYFEEKTLGEINQGDLDAAYDAVNGGYSKFVKELIVDNAESSLKSLKNLRSKAIKEMNSDKEEDRSAGNTAYTLISKAISGTTKSMNFVARVASDAMASYRTLYVTCGHIVGPVKKRTTKTEEKPTEAENAESSKTEAALYNELFEYAFEVATRNMYDEITFA